MSTLSQFLRDSGHVDFDPAGNLASTDVQAAIEELDSEKLAIALLGAANGVASLDSNGKVPTSQLPATILGALQFQGTWDANANTTTSAANPSLSSGTAEETDVTVPAASTFTASGAGNYWTLSAPEGDFYVWYNVDSGNTDPAVTDAVGIEVAVANTDTATQVATATASAIDAITAFSASPSGAVVTVTNINPGSVTDAADGDAGVSPSVTTQGTQDPQAENGDYFIVSVAGTTSIDGISDWGVGDYVLFNNGYWTKIDSTNAVSSVFGRTGAVTAQVGDYTATQITYSNTTSSLAATNAQTAIDEVDDNVDDLVTLTGVALNSTNLGTFTGTIIADSSTIKAAIQALETDLDALQTASGISAEATSLGTFTGTIISDNTTIKNALQELETDVDAIQTLTGVSAESTDLGTFTGSIISDSQTIKDALQDLETYVEGIAGSTFTAWAEVNSSVTLAEGSRSLVDTSGGALTLTLPATPSIGDELIIRDATGDAETNAITIARNGENIGGLAENLTVNINHAEVHFVYYNSSEGWTVQ